MHDASVHALETDNPFAAFTLIRAYAENAATFMYAIDKPNAIDQLFGLSECPISLGRIVSHAKQSPNTRFAQFGAVYDSLSAYAHPMPTSILASATAVGENGLQWCSGPAFESDNGFLTASGWIVEFADANAHLLEDFAQSQGGNTEFVVLFGQDTSDGGFIAHVFEYATASRQVFASAGKPHVASASSPHCTWDWSICRLTFNHESPADLAGRSLTHRNPMCVVAVSCDCGDRAAGRYRWQYSGAHR